MISALVASVALGLLPQSPASGSQAPQAVPARPQVQVADGVVQIDDVIVSGRPLDDFIRQFVGEVADPRRNRGLARWKDEVCVGVVNLRTDYARYIADRVSQVSLSLGLNPGEPGCNPNIVIIASRDGRALAQKLSSSRQRVFRSGVGQINPGVSRLEDFQNSDSPVRWWLTSVPVDARLGSIAVRLEAAGSPPVLTGVDPSLIQSATRDELRRAIVIVDGDAIDTTTPEQLASYVAMVTLAQIAPDADTAGYPTILSLFDEGAQKPETMTDWDLTYLRSLYGAKLNQIALGAQVRSIANQMARDRRETEH